MTLHGDVRHLMRHVYSRGRSFLASLAAPADVAAPPADKLIESGSGGLAPQLMYKFFLGRDEADVGVLSYLASLETAEIILRFVNSEEFIARVYEPFIQARQLEHTSLGEKPDPFLLQWAAQSLPLAVELREDLPGMKTLAEA